MGQPLPCAGWPDVMTIVLRTTQLYRLPRPGTEQPSGLRGVALCVQSGEMVTITGAPDAGVSTLLHCLAGIIDPDGGVVSVAGHRLSHRTEQCKASLQAAYLGLMLPSQALLPGLTVRENVDVAQQGRPQRSRRRGNRDMIAALGLGSCIAAYPQDLSPSDLTRARLAVALSGGPKLLLADDPTQGMDEVAEQATADLLRDEAARGLAIVVATSSAAVLTSADRNVALANGSARVGAPAGR
jgi:putative ABC transport system ATP-binding protein